MNLPPGQVKMKTANFLPAIVVLALCGTVGTASAVDRASLVEAEREYISARKAEAEGQLDGARHAYLNAVGYAMQSSGDESFRRTCRLHGESLPDVARRGIALQKKMLDKELASPSGKISAKALTLELQRLYKMMQVLEPDNPTWLYLDAVMITNTQNYVKATGILRRCSNLPGGSPEVKNKARTLMAHIKPAYDQQRKWLDEDWEKARKRREEYMKRPIKFEPIDDRWAREAQSNSTPYVDPSSSTSVPSWERQAQNAERNGDYAAADRFRSGSSSFEDGAKHWGN